MYNRHTAKYQQVTLKPRLTNPKPRMVPEEHLAKAVALKSNKTD
jgi:hypothetical protein